MIGRALRAQLRSIAGDVVLLGVVVAAFVMSLTVVTSIPAEIVNAPAGVREDVVASVDTLLAMDGALLAAVYGSFRYTVDRRDGVIAQRLMLQTRVVTFATRLPASAVGGAVVALAAVVGGHIALMVVAGGIPVPWPTIGCTLAFGAVAGLWGLALGILVQAHLAALFVVCISMGVATILALFWGGAVWLPPVVMLEAFGFDVTAVGVMPSDRLDSAVAAGVTAGVVLLVLCAGGMVFLKRDVT